MAAVRSSYSRADWYRAFKFDADRENLFSEVDEEKHIRMRSRVTAGVCFLPLDTLHPLDPPRPTLMGGGFAVFGQGQSRLGKGH
jgi:hypothetical protein